MAGFRSAKTRSNSTASLREWFAWTEAMGIDPCHVQRRDVEAYVDRLEQAGYAPDTICQRIATLSSFYRWAVAEDCLTRNPVEGARRPRKPAESTAQGLSRHEVTDWLDAAEARVCVRVPARPRAGCASASSAPRTSTISASPLGITP